MRGPSGERGDLAVRLHTCKTCFFEFLHELRSTVHKLSTDKRGYRMMVGLHLPTYSYPKTHLSRQSSIHSIATTRSRSVASSSMKEKDLFQLLYVCDHRDVMIS